MSSDDLRTHFASLGVIVTDARVVTKPDGTSRGMGFVGFQREEEARRAQQYYSGTWLSGGRIKVDFAHDVSRPFASCLLVLMLLSKAKDRLTRPRKRARLSPETPAAPPQPVQPPPAADVNDEAMSDREYMARRMRHTLTDMVNEKKVEEVPAEDVVEKVSLSRSAPGGCLERLQEPADADEIIIARTGRLFLRNLPFSVSEDDVRTQFERFGAVRQVIKDSSSLLGLLPRHKMISAHR